MRRPRFIATIAAVFCLLAAASAQAATVLLVVVNSASLVAEETAIKTQFQSWGYSVTTVSQNATQANIDAAVAAADVVYIPSTIQEWVLTSALRTATKGVVCAERYEDVYMGFSTGLGWDYGATQMNITVNSHDITTGFSTGLLTICNASATCALMNPTIASGFQKLADQNFGNYALGVIEAGDALAQTTNGNSTATARRVRLCWGGDNFSISSLNSNGLAILQRSLLWASAKLVARWKLDESSGTTAADATGNGNTGTVTGTTNWTSAIMQNGFAFDGSTKIQATGLMANPKNVSVTAWANLSAADTAGSDVISLGDHFGIRLDASGVSEAFFYTGSSYVTAAIGKTYAGTGWHHLAAVFDDDNNVLYFYVDGVLAASTSTTSSISYSGLGSNTIIGRNGNGATDKDFTGTIDDVRVYNYALSATAVADLYGLIGYWKLDETSGTNAVDSSPKARNGTVTGTASWTACIVNNGFSFNGSSKVQISGLLGNPRNVTVAAWANLTTADSGGSEVVSLGDCFSLRLDESSAVKVYYYNGSSRSSLSVTKTVAGTGWHHYVATFDDDNDLMKLYIDGELAGSTSATSSISYANQGANTVIGQHGNGSTTRDFTGRIDEVRVYNRVISNSEIVALHGLIGHWKLTETSGTSAADTTLNGNNGIYQNGVSLGTSSSVPGYNVAAAVFDGNDDYISVPNEWLYDVPGSMSLAAWVNVTAFDKLFQSIIGKGNGTWRLQRDSGNSAIQFAVSGLTTTKVVTTANLTDGKWHHLAGVYDGNNLTIYVDGVLNATTSTSGTPATGNTVVYIGDNAQAGGRQWHGAMYDVRVYNRAITQEEITQLYGSGGTPGVKITRWVEAQ